MNETISNDKSIRRVFSRIGFALCAMLLIATVCQFLWVNIPSYFLGTENWFTSSSWGVWIGSFAPLYLIAIPVGVLILRKLPTINADTQKLTTRQFLTFIPMCICLMYAGNLVGTVLSLILSGGQAQNNLLTYAMDTNPIKILVMVILAPMLEELVFRKLLIDRTRQYGEKTAVILSAFLFALFHQNLYQFFYAFALGVIFGYIYVRTSKLHYSIILHASINFLGSVIAPWIITKIDMDNLMKLTDATLPKEEMMEIIQSVLPGYMLLMLYSAILVSMSVWGLVLIIVKSRRTQWQEAQSQLQKGTVAKTVYLNVGMILFIVLCSATTIYTLLK